MAFRTDAATVKLIFNTTMPDPQINAFIVTANLVVTENLADSGLSDERLTEIEKWLTAHLASTRDQRTQSETVDGRTTLSFQGKTGMGLDATYYGQMVKTLDTTGILSEMGAGLKRATIEMIDSP